MEKIDQPKEETDFRKGVEPGILSCLLRNSHLNSFLENLSCPSCFLIKEDIKGCINCGRIFSTDCIQKILETSHKCPNCRSDWNANSHYNPGNLKSIIDDIKKTLERFENLSNGEEHCKVMQHFCLKCEECFCDDGLYEGKHKNHDIAKLKTRYEKYNKEMIHFHSEVKSILDNIIEERQKYESFTKDSLENSINTLKTIKTKIIKVIDKEVGIISTLINEYKEKSIKHFEDIGKSIQTIMDNAPFHERISDIKKWRVPLKDIKRISDLKVSNIELNF